MRTLLHPRFHRVILLCCVFVLVISSAAICADYPEPGKGCLASKCHAGIEPIREHDSNMAKQIYAIGRQTGDPNGCVVCHGGNPKEEKDKKIAHSAPPYAPESVFISLSGSMWINDKTCGQCHQAHVYAGHRSIMQTQAGIIQGALWGWSALRNIRKNWNVIHVIHHRPRAGLRLLSHKKEEAGRFEVEQ